MLAGRLIETKTMFQCLGWDPQDPRSVITRAMVSRSFRVCINKQARSHTSSLSLHLVLSKSELWAPSQAAGLCWIARHSQDWSQVGIIHYPWPVLAAVCSIHCTLGRSPHSRQRGLLHMRISSPQCSAHHTGLGQGKMRREVQWMLISRIIFLDCEVMREGGDATPCPAIPRPTGAVVTIN